MPQVHGGRYRGIRGGSAPRLPDAALSCEDVVSIPGRVRPTSLNRVALARILLKSLTQDHEGLGLTALMASADHDRHPATTGRLCLVLG
jgi:hypothetical protein